jgi:hypothetical protein
VKFNKDKSGVGFRASTQPTFFKEKVKGNSSAIVFDVVGNQAKVTIIAKEIF